MTLQTVGQAPRVQIQLLNERRWKAINWDLSSNKHIFKLIGQLKRASFFFPLTQTEESLLLFGSNAISNCLEPDVVHPPPRLANQTGGTGYGRCRQIVQTKRNGNTIARESIASSIQSIMQSQTSNCHRHRSILKHNFIVHMPVQKARNLNLAGRSLDDPPFYALTLLYREQNET